MPFRLLIVFLIVMTAACFFYIRQHHLVPAQKREQIISTLRSVPASFWVTCRHTVPAVYTLDAGSRLWGVHQGQVALSIQVLGGVDATKINEQHIRIENRTAVIPLPDPEVLAVIPDLESFRYISKVSGLQLIRHLILNSGGIREQLFKLVTSSLPEYRNPHLYAVRPVVLDQLNRELVRLFEPSGLRVRFE
jgi:hypothetical protein